MTGLEVLAVVAAGMGAGGVNAIVGSGTLISFPTLLAVGFPSVTANVSNNIGLIPGSMAGVWGFRRELAGQRARARRLAVCSGTGGVVGAVLLLTLPSSVFDAVIPALVLLAAALMALSPWLSRWMAGRRRVGARDVGAAAMTVTFFSGIYGGYFGAAQGIILLAMLQVLVPDDLRRSNGLKNLLAGTVNAVAGVFFVIFADVSWDAVALIAVGATVGGLVGARIARWINPTVLRVTVVIYAVAVAIWLMAT